MTVQFLFWPEGADRRAVGAQRKDVTGFCSPRPGTSTLWLAVIGSLRMRHEGQGGICEPQNLHITHHLHGTGITALTAPALPCRSSRATSPHGASQIPPPPLPHSLCVRMVCGQRMEVTLFPWSIFVSPALHQ